MKLWVRMARLFVSRKDARIAELDEQARMDKVYLDAFQREAEDDDRIKLQERVRQLEGEVEFWKDQCQAKTIEGVVEGG